MKKCFKKTLSFILVLTIILSLFSGLSINTYADDLPSSGSCGENVTYTFDSETGTLTISGSGAMFDYLYAYPPFYIFRDDIVHLEVLDGVTSIGSAAFQSCSGLTSVALSDSVTSIGNNAFYNCSGLKELTMPCSAKIYNSSNTFYNCTNIEKVILSKGTGSMCGYIYSTETKYWYTPWYLSRNSLKELIIEDGIKYISANAFNGCSGLTNITIPDSVTSIGQYAFYGCSGLTNIIIPSAVKNIGQQAFQDCRSLKSVVLPSSIESIGLYVFNWCNNLKTAGPTGSNCDLEFGWETAIPNNAFYGCSSLTSITIPDSVTSIGDGAFCGCSGLTNIAFPDSVTSIGASAFSGCSGLTSITIPEAVTSIGGGAFYNCSGLTGNIIIPDSVTSIGSSAFYGCSGLINIIIPESITSIGDSAFYGCSELKSITIPNSVTSIGYFTFRGCSGLTSVTIGNSVTSIGSRAFVYCSKLTSVTIPDSVESIGEDAFLGCSKLATIDITSNNCRIYNSANTLPETATIIINGSKNVCDYAKKYNRNYICNHIEESDEAKEPTCTDVGLTAGTHCKVCGTVLVEQEISAPSLGHTPAEAVRENEVAPTCVKAGSYDEVVYCSVCKQEISRKTETIAKLAHTPANEPVKENEVAPTCTEAGSYDDVVYCTVCKQELSRQTKAIDKLGHDLKVVETIAPTYTEEGYDVLQCQRAGCNYSCYGNYVPATLASISVSLKEPISLLERADAKCYDRTDLAAMQQYGEFYYEYNYSIFKPGNAITLTATDGTKEVFTYSEDTGEFMNAEGEGIYPAVTDTQSEITPWTVGTNYFTVSYGDKSVNVPVTIRKNPIVQIVFMPKNPYIYTQYADGDWDTYQASEFDAPVRYFRYDLPSFKSGDMLAVSYDDGVLHYNTDYTYNETKKAFVSATGESISDSEVKCGYRDGNCLDWTIGERGGWFEFAYLGCTTYAGVKIRENYVQSIAFTPLKPYEVIEGNSKEHFKNWDDESESYIEGDYYDAFDIYVLGNQLTVNYKNGSSDTFTCLQINDGLVFANASGEVISPKSVSNQYQKPWTLGSNNTFTVKWSGAQVSVPVTMLESPISDIAYNPAKPVVLVENTGGYYRDNDWYHGKVFFYDNPLFKEGDELLLYYKTGATKKYTAKFVNGKVDFYDSVGNLLEGILWVDDNYQYENPWHLGNYNACVVYYMGQSASVPVSVVKNHTYVTSVIKQPTCTSKGVTQYVCTDCGDTYLETIPMIPHTSASAIKENEVAATCTAVGSYDRVVKCSVCGTEISRESVAIAKLSHSYKNTKIVKPTTVKAGYTNQKCSACGTTRRVCTAPTGVIKTVKCKARSSNAETIYWSAIKGAEGYQIQVSNAAGNAWDKIYNAKTKTSYTIKSLAAGGTYKFRVRIYAKGVDGKYYYASWTKAITSPTLPNGTSLTKVTAGSKSFTAQWKQNKTVNGYQIQYSTNSKFTGAKTVTIKSNKTLKTTVKKLRAKKVYYVRIRTYKTISKVNYFSTWSKAVKVKTK